MKLMNDKPYRAVVGKLMFLACGCRPDVSFAVGRLARFGSKPRPCHWEALQHLLGYINETVSLKLTFTNDPELCLQAFSDSDLGGCQSTGRSITGYCNLLSNACITYKLSLQKSVASSTMVAELFVLHAETQEVLWL
jgi:hypothetical protein